MPGRTPAPIDPIISPADLAARVVEARSLAKGVATCLAMVIGDLQVVSLLVSRHSGHLGFASDDQEYDAQSAASGLREAWDALDAIGGMVARALDLTDGETTLTEVIREARREQMKLLQWASAHRAHADVVSILRVRGPAE